MLPLAALGLLFIQSPAGRGSRPAVTASRIVGVPAPALDGKLDDPAWALATPITGLLQRDPDEGSPASEPVAIRIVYDADALYIGARLYDSDPAGIIARLGRRDVDTHSDAFRVFLDSDHDRRTAFEFAVNAAGVRSDVLVSDDGAFTDDSWDPVWEAATSVDSLGWCAEMRIPFSTLRFSDAPAQVWGIAFERWIQRKNELAMFPFVPKTANGLVSHFADLTGLRDLASRRDLELLPYALARGTYHDPTDPSNPLDGPERYVEATGGDVQYAVNSNVALDATVNPDFGQVELDPAYVNLTAFEQFLPEHRPFFVEGEDIFGFGGNGGGLIRTKDSTVYFYSRRIGRPPQGRVTSPGQFIDMPSSTSILGAAKLTGNPANGWSLGLLDAVTGRAWATVVDTTAGLRARDEVEPLTNHLVGRLRRELRGGNATVGALATAVYRNLDTPALAGLNTVAYAGGLDLFDRWGHNTYTVAANVGGSYIQGDSTAIRQAQRSSNRYYQRPDAKRFRFEPGRTALAGVTGEVYVNKVAGAWNWSVAASTRSPGFEVNDLGYQTRVDRTSVGAALRRQWTRAGGGAVFRQGNATLSVGAGWNYDGDWIQGSAGLYAYGQFRNFWAGDVSAAVSPGLVDDRLTRGGPLARKPPGWQASAELYTDDRAMMSGYLYLSYAADSAGGWSFDVLPLLTVRHGSALSASIGPRYAVSRTAAQYVGVFADSTAIATFGARYVFAELEQHSVDIMLRLNATFSPNLSVQLYAQPFVFSGGYRGFKELAATRSFAFNTYGRDHGSTIRDTVTGSGAGAAPGYVVDPDGAGPAAPFVVRDPDFRTRSVQINAVLRWEFRPGSTLYLVWTQRRSGYLPFDSSFRPTADLGRNVWIDRPTNVLLLKLDYRLSW